jgi:hypothetical protein
MKKTKSYKTLLGNLNYPGFFLFFGGLLLLSPLISCDILRLSPFEVSRWSPGTGYHEDPAAVTVSASFSHDPDTSSVEYSFSLTEDGSALNGTFAWEGRTMVFKPAVPLELNRDYVFMIREEAHDKKGVSLDTKFQVPFTTRGAGKRPGVISVAPQDMGTVTEPWQEIRLEFSEPVKVTSCVNAISFSPSTGGSWRLEAEDRQAVFMPQEPWLMGTLYRIQIEPDFSNALGLTLGKEFTSYFTVGNDKIPPVLEAAYALDPEGNPVISLLPEEDGPLLRENPRWESAYRLRLDFSEPVDTADLKNRLTVEPALALTMETEAGYAPGVVFSFDRPPPYLSSFLLRLAAGVRDEAGNRSTGQVVFRMRADGPYSKPPALIGLRLPMAPGGIADDGGGDPEPPPLPPEQFYGVLNFSLEDPFQDLPIIPGTGRYPYTVSTDTWLELYFDIAPGADIDLLSLMNLFRVETTHSALSFFPRTIEAGNFLLPNKPPAWEEYYRIKVKGLLTNTISSGVVVFQIGSGLQDSLGNRNELAFKLPLLK